MRYFFLLMPFALFAETRITFFHSYQAQKEHSEELISILEEEQKTATYSVHAMSMPTSQGLDAWSQPFLRSIDLGLLYQDHFSKNLERMSLQAQAKNIPIFASNVLDDKDLFFPKVLPYQIYEVEGIKIGVFSLAEAPSPKMGHHTQSMMRGFLILSPVFVTKTLVERLRTLGCSYIVVFSELPFERDVALVKTVRAIDLVIGSHAKEAIAFYEQDTLIYKSSRRTSTLNRFDIVVSEERLLGLGYPIFYAHFRKIPIGMKKKSAL
ncbi:MAG: hypothetical protein AAGI90_03160 [Chlamydiota bacterium]